MSTNMERSTEKVRWGILGTGRITHRFVQDFACVRNGEMVAVASRSQETADAIQARKHVLCEKPFTVGARKAPNGVEDDLVMLFDYGEAEPACTATLATSFRCRLPNRAHIVGEEGYIAIPDFWCAGECHLHQLDECVQSFGDGRTSLGFDYEIEAASRDILHGRQQNTIMPWSATVRFQEHMDRVRKLYSEK